jgi:hypothetical protein
MAGRDPLNTISGVDALCNLVLPVEINLFLLLTNEAISCCFQESIKKKKQILLNTLALKGSIITICCSF